MSYDDTGLPKLSKIKRISKPSRRVYVSQKEIFTIGRGYGKIILSTPKGIMIGSEARKQKVGGEVLAEAIVDRRQQAARSRLDVVDEGQLRVQSILEVAGEDRQRRERVEGPGSP